jgi:hypothetical protein
MYDRLGTVLALKSQIQNRQSKMSLSASHVISNLPIFTPPGDTTGHTNYFGKLPEFVLIPLTGRGDRI